MDPSLRSDKAPQEPIPEPIAKENEKAAVGWQGKEVSVQPGAPDGLHRYVSKEDGTSTSSTAKPIKQRTIERLIDPKGKNSELFKQNTDPDKLQLVELLRPHVPILNEAIKALAENYEKGNKDQLAIQHRNLDTLAETIFSALMLSMETNRLSVEDKELIPPLLELTSERMPQLRPYLTGEEVLRRPVAEKMVPQLATTITNIIAENAAATASGGLKKGKIKPEMLQTSIKLMDVVREGIETFKRMGEVRALGTSVNAVFAMPKGFFKTMQTEEKSGAVIEKMMWDMAEALHVQDFFAPTTITHIPGKFNSGTIDTKKPGNVGGGAQNAISGLNLRKTRPTTVPLTEEEIKNGCKQIDLDRQSVLEATLISWVFGMYDAHSNNVRITDDGHVKFFDNARSMPKSNDVIFVKSSSATYRCELNATDIAYSDLSPQEKEALKKKFEEIKSHVTDLDNYFNSPSVKLQIKKLPPGWFDQNNITAFKERLTRIEKALQDPNLNKLIELTMAFNPYHKFNVLLEFTKNYPNKLVTEDNLKSVLDICIQNIVFNSITSWVFESARRGVNPKELFNASIQSTSFFDLLKKVKMQLDESNLNPPSESIQEEYRKLGTELSDQLYLESVIDIKDLNKREIPFTLQFAIQKKLSVKGFTFITRPHEISVARMAMLPGKCFIGIEKEKLTLFLKEPDGRVKHYRLDIVSKPGLIIVHYEGGALPPCTPEEFEKSIANAAIGNKPPISTEGENKSVVEDIITKINQGQNPRLSDELFSMIIKAHGKEINFFQIPLGMKIITALELLALCPNVTEVDFGTYGYSASEVKAMIGKLPHFRSDILNHQLKNGGNFESVKAIVEAFPDSIKETKVQRTDTYLESAAKREDKEGYKIFRYLVEQGADINIVNNGASLLSKLIVKSDTEMVAVLLANNVDLTLDEHSPLFYASSKEIMRLLIEKGCDPFKPEKDGTPPIIGLVSRSEPEILNEALAYPHIDLNVRDKDGTHIFIEALKRGNLLIIAFLKGKGFTIPTPLNENEKSLMAGAINRFYSNGSYALLAEVLVTPELREQAAALIAEKNPSLAQLIKEDKFPLVLKFQELVKTGTLTNIAAMLKDNLGLIADKKFMYVDTYLESANNRKDGEAAAIFRYLVEQGANLNDPGYDYDHPVAKFCSSGPVETIQLCFEKGVVLSKDHKAKAMNNAISGGNAEVIKFLIAQKFPSSFDDLKFAQFDKGYKNGGPTFIAAMLETGVDLAKLPDYVKQELLKAITEKNDTATLDRLKELNVFQ